ncbi:MAG: ATP-binding protein [Aigarchaeota archaeon]|nr:ATP-binding protein [Aigarchaeota archaeon]MDW8092473.1 ATP-binding protein [Nitrososphaerota archaeon]
MDLRISHYVNTLEEVGIVVGESNPSSFIFSVHPHVSDRVLRWEYVVAPAGYGLIVGQVREVTTLSILLKRDVDYEVLLRLSEKITEECKHWRRAQVLVHVEDPARPEVSGYTRVRYAITPGTRVYLAPSGLLSRIYSGAGKALRVGHLTTRPDVEIALSASGFRRHLAIIAQTGAGKSYLTGVLLEELLEKGATIVVLDPHGDYVRLSSRSDHWTTQLARRVYVYRVLDNVGRYADVENVRRLSVNIQDLKLEEIFYISGIREKFVQIKSLVSEVIKDLKLRGRFSIREVIEELERASEDVENKERRKIAIRALPYLDKLQYLSVLGDTTTNFREFLAPKRLSVIDLSGLSDRESELIAYLILKEIFRIKTAPEDKGYRYPVFIFIEEAHRFLPPALSGEIIKRIAAEGRKFGAFLTLITHRPSKVHPDVLSQCNSQIIMRITNPSDQQAVLEASERLGKELLEELPSLGTGEAVVVGEVINIPAVIMVRRRRSREGGMDVDVDRLLDEALESAEREERADRDLDEFRRWVRPS